MNEIGNRPLGIEAFKSLQILETLSDDPSVTQRDISQRLGIALGLVNSYVKNLVAKGYITVKAIPRRRYAYYLTPKGFTEKTRLAFDLFQDYTRIYRQTKTNIKGLFKEMQESGVRRVVFAGVDEVAEIAYITLQETSLELSAVLDDEQAGKRFFGRDILSLNTIKQIPYDCIVITSYVRRGKIFDEILGLGVNQSSIKKLFL